MALLVEERRLLDDLRAALARLPATADGVAALRQAFLDLDELFLLVVVGEFNAGKSAFLNALIGESLLPKGVTPTTTAINLIRYADERRERWLGDTLMERGFPSEWLRHTLLVDTPGTNAIIRRHEEITQHFVPRSDLVLFVTSVDRPFSESERAFLEHIRQWGKKIVIILNKIDLLEGEDQLAEIVSFITDNSQHLLGFAPQVFPLSARLALQAKQLPPGPEREAIWERSRFRPLEQYVRDTLDDRERLRLKLLSPLGVADKLVQQCLNQSREELAILNDDSAAVEAMQRQINLYADDMAHDFRLRLSEVELILHRMADRGRTYFDETLRLGRAFDLFNADKLRGEFERKVVGDTAREVEDAVRELSDWLVEREQFLWRSAAEYLERRRSARGSELMLGEVGQQFDETRRELLAALTRTSRQAMASFDKEAEAQDLALSVRTAIAQTAVAEAGAVGLGAVVVALATTAAVDVTGILAASLVAGLGLFILPLKRRRAQEEFRQKIEMLRARLAESLEKEFAQARARTLQRLREAVGPYVRFVHAERERREAARTEMLRLAEELASLRSRIG